MPLSRLPFLLLALAFVLPFAGCGEKPVPTTSGSTGTSTSETSQDRCEIAITNIHDIFQLSRLGVSTSLKDGVARVNDWYRPCGGDLTPKLSLPEGLRAQLTKDQLEFIENPRFQPRDGEHVQDCVLFKTVANYAVGDADTELARTVNLFNHVVRNVALVAQHPYKLPLTPYEVYLLGQGTAADRAWIFAGLLRQLRIDALLVLPQFELEQIQAGVLKGHAGFLVGAVLDDRIYLFDPQIGLPLPGPDALQTGSVATLTQAADVPQLLRQLDDSDDHPYPFTADALKKSKVALIEHLAWWSPRMAALETQFTGERSLALSVSFADAPDSPGLFSRILKAGAGRWDDQSISLWPYPEDQLHGHANLSEQQVNQFKEITSRWRAYGNPLKIDPQGFIELAQGDVFIDPAADKFDPGQRVVTRMTQGEQLRTRLLHVEGKLEEAIKGYTNVRLKCLGVLKLGNQKSGPRLKPEDERIHRLALDDDAYFTALCQFEEGAYATAVQTLQSYLKNQKEGEWRDPARLLLAHSLAALKEFEKALAELESLPETHLESLAIRWFQQKWKHAPAKNAAN